MWATLILIHTAIILQSKNPKKSNVLKNLDFFSAAFIKYIYNLIFKIKVHKNISHTEHRATHKTTRLTPDWSVSDFNGNAHLWKTQEHWRPSHCHHKVRAATKPSLLSIQRMTGGWLCLWISWLWNGRTATVSSSALLKVFHSFLTWKGKLEAGSW